MYANLCRCHFITEEVDYLRQVITTAGIKVDKRKVEAVTYLPTPATVKDIQSDLGLCNYYRKFINYFARVEPL